MSTTTLPHVLRRVYADGTSEHVSSHPDFGEGWAAGQSAVHADRENAYALYAGNCRVAKFGHARITRVMPRLSVANLDALVIS